MAGSVLPAARTYKGCDRRFRNAGFDDDLDEVADRLDALRAASRGRVADFLRTETPWEGSPEPPTEVNPQVRMVETRGIEPLTPALQRRCSAN